MGLENKYIPSRGQFIWNEEGLELESGKKGHSRNPHVPSESSGCTIGRGYDMKGKKSSEVYSDLIKADPKIDKNIAKKLSDCAGKKGAEAKRFLNENNLNTFEISKEGQLNLFKKSYNFERHEARRLCRKRDVTEKYGNCKWEDMNPHLQELIVDLKYQGLYDGQLRKKIQEHIVKRDYKKLNQALRDNLPRRFKIRNEARLRLLEKARNYDLNKQTTKTNN